MPHKITVRTNGQPLTVNASISHWTSEALALVASGDDDVESSTTTPITSDYDLWFANTATEATITVKQLDGTTILAQTFPVTPGHPNRTLNPVPDPFQTAADLSRPQQGIPRAYVAGRYYMSGDHYIAASALGTGVMSVIPFWVGGPVLNVDRLAVEATATAATAVARLGIYGSNANDLPDALVVDAGTVDISSAAIVEATVDVELTRGLYWLAAVSQVASGTMRNYSTASFGIISAASAATAFGSAGHSSYRLSSITGALPASFGTTYTPGSNGYKVVVRAAA